MSDGASCWQVQEWESDFFGIKTARILGAPEEERLVQGLIGCSASGVRAVHWLVNGDDDTSVRLAELHDFHLVDVRITLECQSARQPERGATDPSVRRYEVGDLPSLQAIARASYHHTRYYHDPRYPRERCDALYAAWIANSCDGDAQIVLVAEQGGEVGGYITCHLPLGTVTGQIGLVGVDARMRGQGFGRLLVQCAQQWFFQHGAERVSVVTQGRNIEAQRLYQRCGFVTSALQLWYHR